LGPSSRLTIISISVIENLIAMGGPRLRREPPAFPDRAPLRLH
jgi:hypothetical protein